VLFWFSLLDMSLAFYPVISHWARFNIRAAADGRVWRLQVATKAGGFGYMERQRQAGRIAPDIEISS